MFPATQHFQLFNYPIFLFKSKANMQANVYIKQNSTEPDLTEDPGRLYGCCGGKCDGEAQKEYVRHLWGLNFHWTFDQGKGSFSLWLLAENISKRVP